MEKKNNAVVKKVIIAVVAVVLLVAAIFLTKTFIDNKNEPSNGDVPSSSQTQTTEPVAKPDYSEYVEQNPETVGWITIPGTQINFRERLLLGACRQNLGDHQVIQRCRPQPPAEALRRSGDDRR